MEPESKPEMGDTIRDRRHNQSLQSVVSHVSHWYGAWVKTRDGDTIIIIISNICNATFWEYYGAKYIQCTLTCNVCSCVWNYLNKQLFMNLELVSARILYNYFKLFFCLKVFKFSLTFIFSFQWHIILIWKVSTWQLALISYNYVKLQQVLSNVCYLCRQTPHDHRQTDMGRSKVIVTLELPSSVVTRLTKSCDVTLVSGNNAH